jgi:NADPH2:quinone reductase
VGRIYDGTSEGFLVKAAILPEFGGIEVLRVAEVPVPSLGPHEVLIAVSAAGVNRADILQRRGMYPPPSNAPGWPGLEVAGVVAEVGDDVSDFGVGDRVCALVTGGGYAEFVVCATSLVFRTPEGISDVEAAALPEALCTVLSNLRVGGLPGIGSLLVHGGSGGIGTTAIQIGKALGLTVMVTAGGPERTARCAQLGADVAIDYRSEDFAAVVSAAGGVDMVLDCIGGEYLAQNLSVLKDDGTLVVIGLQNGAQANVNLAALLSRRLTIAGTGLRTRPLGQRAAIVRDVTETLLPLIPQQIRPVIHEVVPLAEVSRAHDLMERRAVFGKVVLSVS